MLIATFVAVALFRASLVWTVLIAGVLSVGYEYVRSPRQQ
jgi:chromate transporter